MEPLNPSHVYPAQNITRMAEVILLDAPTYQKGIEDIRDRLIDGRIRPYFEELLARHHITASAAVQRANLDKDYGRQILAGKRMARRDTYIQLAFGIGLSDGETQSMLNFLGMGLIYAVRERDAAILYALLQGYDLMKAQLLLDEYGLAPLGDPDTSFAAGADTQNAPPCTIDIEQRVREAQDFGTLTEEVRDRFMSLSVSAYFDKLLAIRGLTRAQALSRAGIKESIGFQLLSGIRTAKNRDMYVRLALGIRLTLDETQQLLKFLKKGALYPLKERDAALLYCAGHGFTLDEAQGLLLENGLAPL